MKFEAVLRVVVLVAAVFSFASCVAISRDETTKFHIIDSDSEQIGDTRIMIYYHAYEVVDSDLLIIPPLIYEGGHTSGEEGRLGINFLDETNRASLAIVHGAYMKFRGKKHQVKFSNDETKSGNRFKLTEPWSGGRRILYIVQLNNSLPRGKLEGEILEVTLDVEIRSEGGRSVRKRPTFRFVWEHRSKHSVIIGLPTA